MQIRDLNLNVQISGEGDPTFIWGHGLSTSIEAEDMLGWFGWESFPASIRLVRYDARGHGQSDLTRSPADYHWRNLGLDMIAVADAVGAETFIAGGASMGCATSIYAALQAPDRVSALLLVIPPTAWETRAAQGAVWTRNAWIGRILGGGGMASAMKGQLDRMLPEWMLEHEPERLEGMLKGMAAQKRAALWNIFRGAGLTDLPPRDELQAITHIPCQILCWEGDPVHPISTAEELHRLLPQSDLYIARTFEEFKTIPQRIRDFV